MTKAKKTSNKGRKPKKSNNNPRVRVKQTKIISVNSRRQGLPMEISRLIFSMKNPFDSNACVPDGARGVSCFSIKQAGVLGPGVAGTVCGLALNPTDPRNIVYVDSAGVTTGMIVSGNWAAASQIASVVSFYGKIRPVSAGIRMVYIGNTQTDAGVIVGAQNSGSTLLSSFAGANAAQLSATAEYYKIIPLRNGIEVIWRANDMEDIGDFRVISSAVSATSTIFSAPYLAAWAFGVASNTNCIQYEWIVNYEGQIANQTFMSGGAELGVSSSPARPGWFEHAMNSLGNYIPINPILNGVSTAAGQGVQQYAGRVITQGLGTLANGFAAQGVLSATQRYRRLA